MTHRPTVHSKNTLCRRIFILGRERAKTFRRSEDENQTCFSSVFKFLLKSLNLSELGSKRECLKYARHRLMNHLHL